MSRYKVDIRRVQKYVAIMYEGDSHYSAYTPEELASMRMALLPDDFVRFVDFFDHLSISSEHWDLKKGVIQGERFYDSHRK